VPRAATQVTRKTAARKGPAKPTLTQIERRLGHPGLFAEIRTSLQAAFGPRLKGLVLYGSQARGDAGPESDVDILVLLDEPYKRGRDQWTIIRAIHGLQMKMDHYLSAKPVPAEEYEEAEWPLYSHAQREGVPL